MQVPIQRPDTMRDLLKSELFRTIVVVLLVPFGWIYPLLRFAVRRLAR